MRILTLDIETSPNLADVWGLFQQNVSLSQLRESTRVIAFAAKWYGQRPVEFYSDFGVGHEAMIANAHTLLDEADAVVTYNGRSFDMPWLRREMLQQELPPPSPAADIDLYRVVKSRFRFASNKLDHVAQELGLGRKVQHSGHDLWVRCMAGDPKAWRRMELYNKGDVRLTERLYDRLKPWIPSHPHHALYEGSDRPVCQRCGSTKLQRRGSAYTRLGSYPRFQCQGCGGWSQGSKRIAGVEARGIQ